MLCYKCQNEIPDNSLMCPRCGAEMSDYAREQYRSGVHTTNTRSHYLPMNWYKFLIYFMLFADAVMCICNAVSYITGEIYHLQSFGEFTATEAYTHYGVGLRYADILYAAALVIFAVLVIVARFKLAGFKKDGPLFLYISYGVNAFFALAYVIAVSIITDAVVSNITAIIWQFTSQAVYIYLNYLYFKKRKHLFVN